MSITLSIVKNLLESTVYPYKTMENKSLPDFEL